MQINKERRIIVSLQERIHHLNEKPISQGKYILYWMSRAKRVHDNPGLFYAITLANQHKLPLLFLFVVSDEFPDANQKHYQFILEGIKELTEEPGMQKIRFVIALGRMVDIVTKLAKDALIVVSDTVYLRITRWASKSIAEKISCPMYAVEGDVLFPVHQVASKSAYGAQIIRRSIYKMLPFAELDVYPFPEVETVFSYQTEISLQNTISDMSVVSFEELKESSLLLLKLQKELGKYDPSVGSATPYKGGYSKALQHLRTFIEERLEIFQTGRNNPALDCQSNLSPYLHFGQISIRQVLDKVIASLEMSPEDFFSIVLSYKPGSHPDKKVNGALELFEEAIVRRELSFNLCRFNNNYDHYSIIPEWARRTLQEHTRDYRPYIYTVDQLEHAKTHDPYWNAAQMEMIKTGKMHGYMRMYWGKKIIEWSAEPEEAFKIALYLNNKYELDGRDPNGFAGVGWCFGLHDRAWAPFPIFGKVRTMTAAGLERKFDMKKYIERINRL